MYAINSLDDIHANQVVIYTIKSLLKTKTFPKFSLFSGTMGVGKTSVANLVAKELQTDGTPIKVYNFGLNVDMEKVESEVFAMTPALPKAFIFEELHGLSKEHQTALLSMLDRQPSTNVYIIATTTEEDSLLRPLKSRAQRWSFKSLSNKQLAMLLDDYLVRLAKTMAPDVKQALIQAAHGIPRDLVKNVDLALNGDFDANTMNELLGNMGDDIAFSVLCSLKADPTSFATVLSDLIEKPDTVKVTKLRDFWTRFCIESSYGKGAETLSSDMVETLVNLFTPSDKQKITKALIQATTGTLNLQLILLNAMLTSDESNINKTLVGIQRVQKQTAEQEKKAAAALEQTHFSNAKLTPDSLKSMRLE